MESPYKKGHENKIEESKKRNVTENLDTKKNKTTKIYKEEIKQKQSCAV